MAQQQDRDIEDTRQPDESAFEGPDEDQQWEIVADNMTKGDYEFVQRCLEDRDTQIANLRRQVRAYQLDLGLAALNNAQRELNAAENCELEYANYHVQRAIAFSNLYIGECIKKGLGVS